MSKNQYKIKLLEQYKSAEGFTGDKIPSNIHMVDFLDWLAQRKQIGWNYADLLSELNIPFEYRDCAEVGKSYIDTIVKSFGTKIITPYTEGFEDLEEDKIIEGKFEVHENTPSIIIPKESGITTREIISNTVIKTYMTQNPYNRDSIANWHELYNSRNACIILGVYGYLYDKDIDIKINMLKEVRDKLETSFKETYETLGDEYFYIVSSNPLVKKISKSVTR